MQIIQIDYLKKIQKQQQQKSKSIRILHKDSQNRIICEIEFRSRDIDTVELPAGIMAAARVLYYMVCLRDDTKTPIMRTSAIFLRDVASGEFRAGRAGRERTLNFGGKGCWRLSSVAFYGEERLSPVPGGGFIFIFRGLI